MPSAWSAAAGIINPVTGRWMTKSWNIDTLLPEAQSTYGAIEEQFAIHCYHSLPVRRYCQNSDDIKRVGRRLRNPRYSNVLGKFYETGETPTDIRDSHGSFDILHGGYVDLPLLIQTLRTHFSERGQLHDETFDYDRLKKSEGGWAYGSENAARVIFCEGMGIHGNPWFNQLPLTPAKGETLILQSETLTLPPSIYHSTKWLLPYEASRFRIGATYDDSDSTHEPTQSGSENLLSAAKEIVAKGHTFKVEAHLAGIRPSTQDARPFLGEHPHESGLYILNGLGSKGASVAPEMSRQLIEHIFAGETLDPEVNISRFANLT